jgi:hypothetical protein
VGGFNAPVSPAARASHSSMSGDLDWPPILAIWTAPADTFIPNSGFGKKNCRRSVKHNATHPATCSATESVLTLPWQHSIQQPGAWHPGGVTSDWVGVGPCTCPITAQTLSRRHNRHNSASATLPLASASASARGGVWTDGFGGGYGFQFFFRTSLPGAAVQQFLGKPASGRPAGIRPVCRFGIGRGPLSFLTAPLIS